VSGTIKAPKTLFRRPFVLLKWWLDGGSIRLCAARYRRAGDPWRAIGYLCGSFSVIVDIILAYPDIDERVKFVKHAARALSSPCCNKILPVKNV